jgi:alkylation response protein AidB-like acyl-CoA dehydrogenase
MYSFEPNEEQKMLMDVAKRFAEKDLRPAAHDAEEEGGFSEKLINKGWELGVIQASVPEEFGGFGERSVLTSILALEEIAWADMAGAVAIMNPALFVTPILIAGSEEQKAKYLPPVIEAEWKPFTSAMVEYNFDYDPYDLKTTAEKDGDGYILNGEKRFVPFADRAEAMIVYANLEGKTQAFIVAGNSDGLTVGDKEKMMGLNALSTFKVTLENVKLPADSLLPGDVKPLIANAQISLAAMAVGMSKASFEYSREYAKVRDVLGSVIAKKQSIAFFLAEMATEIEAIRLLTWEAAWLLDKEDEEAYHVAYLALLGAIDMCMMVTDRGVQILGGHGYIREHPVELWFRNARAVSALTGLAMV